MVQQILEHCALICGMTTPVIHAMQSTNPAIGHKITMGMHSGIFWFRLQEISARVGIIGRVSLRLHPPKSLRQIAGSESHHSSWETNLENHSELGALTWMKWTQVGS